MFESGCSTSEPVPFKTLGKAEDNPVHGFLHPHERSGKIACSWLLVLVSLLQTHPALAIAALWRNSKHESCLGARVDSICLRNKFHLRWECGYDLTWFQWLKPRLKYRWGSEHGKYWRLYWQILFELYRSRCDRHFWTMVWCFMSNGLWGCIYQRWTKYIEWFGKELELDINYWELWL